MTRGEAYLAPTALHVVRNFSFAARMVPVTPFYAVRDFSPVFNISEADAERTSKGREPSHYMFLSKCRYLREIR